MNPAMVTVAFIMWKAAVEFSGGFMTGAELMKVGSLIIIRR